ncbi:hypothetical protein BDV95DRAFT_593726 [Massariosphaeria phaeospora]|uniref:Uncharacterized protein n=1 Tax=Massariosphaeria phaeospora TaxID=100035 RepID=A0A7C8IAM9_9PLEO|nr:hypothetical protein BDV95DRAFT_593726 [Massariosphaeria phaeospora]
MISVRSIIVLFVSYAVIPRLTFLPRSVHSLLIVFGPFLLPRLISIFTVARATSRSVPVRPTPPKVQRALNLLVVSVVGSVVLSLPYFADENIFTKTQSRLQTEPGVLFTRLQLLRELTGADEALRTKFGGSAQNKLLYLAYGPDALVNCIWCATALGDDQLNYFLYSLPKLAAPHIVHLAVLGLATSSLVGAEGSRFRIHATLAGLLLMVADMWYLGSYDLSINRRARSLQELDFAHWRVHFLRYMSFAVIDLALGVVLWATSTNRWLAQPPSLAKRIESTTRQAEETVHKLRALGLLKNSINRNPALRGVTDAYWNTEGGIMAETVQEEEVMEQINSAVSKMNLPELEGRVGAVADGILAGIDGLRASQIMAEGTAAAPAPS